MRRMKELVVGGLCGAMMVVAMFAFCFDWSGAEWKSEEMYVLEATYYNGHFVDENGELWGYDAEIPSGTSVEVIMSDNGTPSDIYDDVVVSVE